jgi:hypothetical protein
MNCPYNIGKGTRLLKCSLLIEEGKSKNECYTQRFCPSRGKYICEQFNDCPLYKETLAKTDTLE